MDVRAQFVGKKITIMGLGLLGRGVGDALFLARQGANLIITDLKTEEELRDSLALLSEYSTITYVLGRHRLEDFRDRDFILKAAGVPLDSLYIEEAQKEGIPIKMSASWFAKLSGVPLVGVTGTRGKSTVTHMLHAIMQEAGMKVLLGGNVRGVSTLALLDDATPEHYGLFELDSWQCQGLGDEQMSPHIAVFTTFMPDHMNYYKDDMEVYLRDKANIFLYQRKEDTLVLGTQCADLVEESFSARMQGTVIRASEETIPTDWKLHIPGEHNRYDAGLSLAVARALSIPDDISKKALEAFSGVPGRLEHVRTINGVAIYNDTNATTPDATVAALRALPKGKTILIMGGADKGLDMRSLVAEIPTYAKHVLFLSGTGTDRVRKDISARGEYTNITDAVREAQMVAEPGDAVLFSPVFASFGMFKNEYDRGDQFNVAVATLL